MCADGVIFEKNDIGISEASLTGESVIKRKGHFVFGEGVCVCVCVCVCMCFCVYVHVRACECVSARAHTHADAHQVSMAQPLCVPLSPPLPLCLCLSLPPPLSASAPTSAFAFVLVCVHERRSQNRRQEQEQIRVKAQGQRQRAAHTALLRSHRRCRRNPPVPLLPSCACDLVAAVNLSTPPPKTIVLCMQVPRAPSRCRQRFLRARSCRRGRPGCSCWQ